MLKRVLSNVFSLTPVTLLLLMLLAAASAQAQLRSQEIRFLPPADARVVGFHVYVSANSMSYVDWRDDVNFIPPVDASGAASFMLTGLEAFDDVYIAMKSYDVGRQESALSNEIVLPAQQQCSVSGCNDNNPCTRDTCGASGCTFDPAPLRGTTCSDGNATTYNDVCSASGSCAGTPGQCNVAADCPASSNPCAGPQACSNHACVAGAARADGTSCDDGSPSTRYDICEAGTCRGYACGSDAQCSDGESCNGVEHCLSRSCVAGASMVCGDGNICNGTESCRASTCVAGTALQCPLEGGPCFDAFCDLAQGCRVEPHPDGSTCTTATSGLAGQCASGICDAGTTSPPDGGGPTTCDTAYGPPGSVHQVLTASSETARKIVWSAPLHPLGALLEYRLEFESAWTSLRASPESSRGCDAIWSVTLSGLYPRQRYVYRVSGASPAGRVFSESYLLRTGSVTTRDQWKFAFFASNGLNGSAQSPQATNVLAQIKNGAFPLVLGGGGYTLSTEAIASRAAATTAEAVAAWKQQASVVTANSIFAPVLGDTEVESFAHGERAADFAEFMTRASPNQGYSFDFSGAHFVALHAPGLGSVHPGTAAGAAQLAWLEADLAAARAARARWIVVYMHLDLLSSEHTDAVTASVRQALGAILQRYGVNLVLSGSGNSYERSRALRGALENPIAGPLTYKVVTATDGIVFVRAGSGGRTAFGRWLSATRPSWSAVRNNTKPVYLSVTADGNAMGVIAYGLDASGLRTVIDAVEIR